MNWTALVFCVFLVGAAVVYPFWAREVVASWFGQLAQFVALVLGAWNATQTFDSYGKKDEPRQAWFVIAVGLWVWVIAQVMASYKDLVLHQIPYGDLQDIFWCIGYLFLITGIWRLAMNFWKSGLPVGSQASYAMQFSALVVLFFFVLYYYIWGQVTQTDRPIAERILDVVYPVLDLVLVGMISILVRAAWMMRGGALARSWIFLCIGFFLVGVADLWLSYAQEFESVFYRLNDLIYFCSYFCIALAGAYQLRMLKSR